MGYYRYKITRMPKRVSLIFNTIPSVPLELEVPYAMSSELKINASLFLGYPAEPLDDFAYQIQHSKRAPWSEDINYTINVVPDAGPPTCTSGSVSVSSKSTVDITHLFVFNTKCDRIQITSISGINNGVFVQGQPLVYNKEYMVYDFINVTLNTGEPVMDLALNTSSIFFNLGTKDEWSPTCSVIVDLKTLTRISSDTDTIQTTPSFEREIYLDDGIPGTFVEVEITPSHDMSSFTASFMSGADPTLVIWPLDVDGPTTILVYINRVGKNTIKLTGVPVLDNEVDPYLVTVDAKILTSAGFASYVHPVDFITTLYITNDISLIESFDAISAVMMDNANMVATADSYIFETEAPSDIDITAEIRLASNIGVPPFTYSIIPHLDNPTLVTIVQQGTTNIFDISTMIGSTSPGSKYRFLASSVDADNVTSEHEFDFTVLNVVVSAVPVITGPTAVTLEEGESITKQIVASNGPILSYAATSLPSSLSLNTSTGVITGSVDNDGSYNITLTATNSFGVSSNYSWSVTVNAPSGVIAPIITSPTLFEISGIPVEYLVSADNSPDTVTVHNLPAGWNFNQTTMLITGIARTRFTYITIYAQNSAGTDIADVTIIDDTL